MKRQLSDKPANHMSREEYQKLIKGKGKPNKYNNIKVEADNYKFDSKKEHARYEELKLLLQAGEIRGFAMQPSFVLSGKIRYRPDFIVCDNNGNVWVEDVKSAGTITAVFKLKQKLWEEKYPWLELRLIT
jgi:hypothetical protein